jgi:hypothetical protein
MQRLTEAVRSKHRRELNQAMILWMKSVFTKEILDQKRDLLLTTIAARRYFKHWAARSRRELKYLVTSSGVEED